MSELQTQIQDQLDNAQPSDIIQLPAQVIDFPLVINNPCTVMGTPGSSIDVSAMDYQHAISINADNVVLSDIEIKNKNESGYHGVYLKGNNASIERLAASCDVGILVDSSKDVELIECEALNATTGIKIVDSSDVEINACSAHNCSLGLDIVGSSSVIGDVDSYQGFGLNIQPTDASPVLDAYYEVVVDDLVFTFHTNASATYQDIVNAINAVPGFNPIYTAEIVNNDIIIKTQNPQIQLSSGSIGRSLLNDLGATLGTKAEGLVYSYIDFGLTIQPDDISPLVPNKLYTFMLDNQEVQFYSKETDGTTYQEMVDLISAKITPNGYIIEVIENDVKITHQSAGIVAQSGDRFEDLFATLGISYAPNSVFVSESYQNLGLNIQPSDVSPVLTDSYLLIINDIPYTFNLSAGMTYQQLVDGINSLPSFNQKNELVIEGGDIKVVTSDPTIEIKENNENIFTILGSSPVQPVSGSETGRTDRSHHINIVGSIFYENSMGVRLLNVNNVVFTNGKIFSNTNVGIWQQPSSYANSFRGEIYNNNNYGARNTDKSDAHKLDIMDSWWGDMTGPSMFGPGEGDKISSGVLWQPQRQSGTIPDLSYPKTRDFILSMLGHPIVKVELTDDQIATCIHMAIEKYMQYRTPEPIQRYIAATGQITKLPPDIPKEEIIEVTYSPNADIFAQLSASGESFLLTYYMNDMGNQFLSDFYIAQAYRETMETTLGIRPSYEFLSARDENGDWADYIRLAPRPSGGVVIGLLVSRPMTEEEIDSVEWISKYALAWAKMTLSQIRGKYGSVPGPTGEMALNASSLEAQAQQEMEKLEEAVMLRGQPLGFTVF
jgi:hypothetical protein